MTLSEQILEAYPELTSKDFDHKGAILLQDDSDGLGAYIARWDYSKPIPDGLKLGK
jgi:hypothetical protein